MERYSTKTLRERGVRVTPQRAHVWEILTKSSAHLRAEEIWEEVREVLPGLELSTVYRILRALEEAGLVVESHFPDGPRIFEARSSVHPHLICEVCGQIFHPEAGLGNQLLATLRAGKGSFAVHDLHVVAMGVCAACGASMRRIRKETK